MEGYTMEENLKGLYAALLVPFDENGQVKEEGLAQIDKNAIETEKLDGLYVNGSSGENFLLSKEQKETSLQSRKRSGQ